MKTKRILIISVLMLILLSALALQTAFAAEVTPPIKVSKSADGSYGRTWEWTIEKTADASTLELSTGQTHQVNYGVTVSASSSTTSDWTVSGRITIYNQSGGPISLSKADVTDQLSNGSNVEVICDVAWFDPLPAGWTNVCRYSATGSGDAPTSNTATVKFGGVDYQATRDITYSVSETDECIDATDDKYGALGTVCAGEAPKTFSYSLTVGPYDVCGDYTYENIASFVTNDTKSTGSDNWIVKINVPCAGGCTLTPGYWKTHSSYGPAPYDDNWAHIGEDTIFFLSGKSYYDVLWTAPQGNAYYILAHAYIAAKLNVLNGAATTPAVVSAIANAETYFSIFAPSPAPSGSLRTAVLSWATTLDNYNNGKIGPGHCSE